MAAVASIEADAQTPAPDAGPTRSRRYPVWRWVILLLAGAYFLIPLYAALRFAGLKAFPDIFKQSRVLLRDRAVAAARGDHNRASRWC